MLPFVLDAFYSFRSNAATISLRLLISFMHSLSICFAIRIWWPQIKVINTFKSREENICIDLLPRFRKLLFNWDFQQKQFSIDSDPSSFMNLVLYPVISIPNNEATVVHVTNFLLSTRFVSQNNCLSPLHLCLIFWTRRARSRISPFIFTSVGRCPFLIYLAIQSSSGCAWIFIPYATLPLPKIAQKSQLAFVKEAVVSLL